MKWLPVASACRFQVPCRSESKSSKCEWKSARGSNSALTPHPRLEQRRFQAFSSIFTGFHTFFEDFLRFA